MQRGTRWVKFLSSHRQKKNRILRHAYWGVLPEGVQPVVGMTVKTGGPKKSHKRRKGVKPKGFELDGSERIVEKFLAPINAPLPPALYAVGLNYKKHAREVKKEMPRNPLTFLLATTSLVGHEQMVRVPKQAQNPMEVDFEVELGIVISRACKNVSVEDAMSYVLGFTVANDISARRWQGKKGGGQWSRSKSFDTFTPLGPCLLVPDECDSLDASALHLNVKTRVNDIEYQNSNTKDMIFNPAEIVSFVSQGTTLEKGTVIITGTPEGVGYTRDPPMFLKDGDVVECEIEDIGILKSKIYYEKEQHYNNTSSMGENKQHEKVEEEEEMEEDPYYDTEGVGMNAVFSGDAAVVMENEEDSVHEGKKKEEKEDDENDVPVIF